MKLISSWLTAVVLVVSSITLVGLAMMKGQSNFFRAKVLVAKNPPPPQSPRRLTWTYRKVEMCRKTSLDPDPVRFKTVKVPEIRVTKRLERGDLEGPCSTRKNCKKLCDGKGSTCDTGQCVGTCTPPTTECATGEICQCRCQDSARRKLSWPKRKVKMCKIKQRNPTKFKSRKVYRGSVTARIQDGELLGSCYSPQNCKQLCFGEKCENGECVPKEDIQAPQCSGESTCPDGKCFCECIPAIVDPCAGVTCTNPLEGCDPFDGMCKPTDAVVPCIAIIDESSNFLDAEIDAKWTNFRQVYPDRPFCLLQPLYSPNSKLYLPTSFQNDPRTTFAQVSRDDEEANSEIQPVPSDWFNICGFAVYNGSDIDFIGKFLDTSGSMRLNTVRASNDLFDQTVSAASLTIQEVFGDFTEDWITPFLTDLVPEA